MSFAPASTSGGVAQEGVRNTLMRSLERDDYALFEPHLERVPLSEGHIVVAADATIDVVCFPECAVTSFVDVLHDGSRIEVGLVGFEGMTGWPVLLGCDRSPHDAVVRAGGGSALLICAARLLEACRQSGQAESLFLRFVQSFTVQMGRTIVSNLRDPLERRLARWLLMCHDRLEGDRIELTHKYIGAMLGVRRATITDSLHVLEGEGVLRSGRGWILIRDRAALERIAGDSYGFAEAQYRRLVAPFGKRGA